MNKRIHLIAMLATGLTNLVIAQDVPRANDVVFGKIKSVSSDAVIVSARHQLLHEEEREYTVNIPVTREVDGKRVTKTREETRVRTVKVPVEVNEMKLNKDAYQFQTLAGSITHDRRPVNLKPEDLNKHVGSPLVVIKQHKIHPYFHRVFKDDVIFAIKTKSNSHEPELAPPVPDIDDRNQN